MPEPKERLRYDEAHWSRNADERAALADYLRLAAKPYNRTKIQTFLRLAGEVRGRRVLDYGGGAGAVAVPLAKAGADVVVVDAEANGLRTARLHAQSEGVEDRIRTIHSETFPEELRSERFDLVIAKDIIEHIADDERFLRDLAACQAPGGTLLASTQNSRSLTYLIEGSYERLWRKNAGWCGWDDTHLRFYTSSSLRGKLAQAGYRAERWAGVFLVPYDILSWLFLRKVSIEIEALHLLDRTLGRVFPFNRLGWSVIVRATRGPAGSR